MEKLILLLCELIEKLDSLAPKSMEDLEVDTDIFPVEITNDLPQKFTGNNQYRLGAWIHNDSLSDLYLAVTESGAGISRDRFSFPIAPGDTFMMTAETHPILYKKSIYGFWEDGAAANSRVMVTEVSATRK